MTENPDSLIDICLNYLSVLHKQLKEVCLPQELCEKLLKTHIRANRLLDLEFATLFADTSKTRLKRIRLGKNSTESALLILLKHKPTHLDISQVGSRFPLFISEIFQHGEDLVDVNFGSLESFNGTLSFTYLNKLKSLTIFDFNYKAQTLSECLIKPLPHLISLDISGARGINTLRCLSSLPQLEKLVLYNVKNLQSINAFTAIKTLKNLRILDISGNKEPYPNPDQLLSSVVESLPKLVYLDISETNLAGRGSLGDVSNNQDKENICKTDIFGLYSRVEKPLEFLGLYDTAFGACRRFLIPALNVAGDANWKQFLLAFNTYKYRRLVIKKLYGELVDICRENGLDANLAQSIIDLALDIMEYHLDCEEIQIVGCSFLEFVLGVPNFSTKMRQRIIQAVVNAMLTHRVPATLRLGCLCLGSFRIPCDFMFDYQRVTEAILAAVEMKVHNTQQYAVYLLNLLVCQVDGYHKSLLMFVIPGLLQVIHDRLIVGMCDAVMEIAWSALWNVTDETPQNSQCFLDWEGMQCFCDCLEKFRDKPDLIKNMMGLIGNVAEVKFLRPQLMKPDYLTIFTRLLDLQHGGLEVSYNAAGVLAHICSDGPEAWTVEIPNRDNVIALMESSMAQWDIFSERNINYCSFGPITSLLLVKHTPVCQLWAVWALANLTKVYPSKYCPLLQQEHGTDALQRLLREKKEEETLSNGTTNARIVELAEMVLTSCRDFENLPLDG